ncbi:MAG: hypothetical protein JWO31_1483 [Phycisphaerales bacterium]|nr:hypothetical protein [Phycisphaerales bacterium]
MKIGRASAGVFLVSLLGWAVATAPSATAAPASAPADRSTYLDVAKAYEAYWRAALVDGYDKVGRRDPGWDEPARVFLRAAARREAYDNLDAFYLPDDLPTPDALVELASAAYEAGCDDPMVICQAARALALRSRTATRRAGPPFVLMPPRPPVAFAALARIPAWGPIGPFVPRRRLPPLGMTQVTRPAVEALLGSGYADYAVAVVARDVLAGPLDPRQRAELANGVRERWLAACCEKPQPRLRRAVMVDASRTYANTDDLGAFIADLQKRPGGADPWVLDNLIGRQSIHLAWASRGSGWAANVTPEGWRGFHQHLSTARDHFAAAWKLDPTFPQSAAEMITVAMGDGDALNEKPLDWFARALEAQVDFVSAYDLMRGALLPRWGGSYPEMLQLADACLAVPRYDTLVPWQYVETVRAIGRDSGQPWGLLTSDPAVYDNVARTAGAYADQLTGRRRVLFRSYQAAAALRAGRRDDVRAALNRLAADGHKPDPAAFEYFGFPDGAMTASAAAVLTADGGAALFQAADAARDGGRAVDARAALAAAAAARGPLAADDPRVPYLDHLLEELKRRSGEWVDLPPGDPRWELQALKGQVGTNTWVRPGEPATTAFTMQGGPGGAKVGLWRPPDQDRQFGSRFEVEATIRSFDGTEGRRVGRAWVAPPGQAVTAGIAFHDPESNTTELAVVDFGRQRAGFAATAGGDSGTGGDDTGGLKPAWDVKVGRTATVRARCVGRTVTLFVDGKAVGEPHELPAAFDGPFQVGIGGLDHWYVEVPAVRYRLIPPGDGPAAGEMPPAPVPPGIK